MIDVGKIGVLVLLILSSCKSESNFCEIEYNAQELEINPPNTCRNFGMEIPKSMLFRKVISQDDSMKKLNLLIADLSPPSNYFNDVEPLVSAKCKVISQNDTVVICYGLSDYIVVDGETYLEPEIHTLLHNFTWE